MTGDGERVAEVGIVERLGIDDVDAVELFIRGIDGDAVGRIIYAGDEVELFGDDAAAPPDGHFLMGAVVVEELELIGLAGSDLRAADQILIHQFL